MAILKLAIAFEAYTLLIAAACVSLSSAGGQRRWPAVVYAHVATYSLLGVGGLFFWALH